MGMFEQKSFQHCMFLWGSFNITAVRLFHVQYYETHIFFLSSLTCETMIFRIFGAANAVPDGVCRGAYPLPYWGIFSDT